MTLTHPADPREESGRVDYYMLRLARSVDSPESVSGMVERLGTGEKRSFASAEQLLHLVTMWSSPKPNMRVQEG